MNVVCGPAFFLSDYNNLPFFGKPKRFTLLSPGDNLKNHATFKNCCIVTYEPRHIILFVF